MSRIRIGRNTLLISGVMLACTTLIHTALIHAAESPEKPAAKAALTRADVNKLLSKARQAMATGKLSKANDLVTQAEGAKLKYPVLNFGDSPSKARRDLKKLMGKQGALTGSRNADGKAATKKDPFQKESTPAADNKQVASKSAQPAPVASKSAQPTTVPNLISPKSPPANPVQQAGAEMPANGSLQNQVQLAAANQAVPIDLTLPRQGVVDIPGLKLAQAPNDALTQLPAAEELLPQPEDAFLLLRNGENALRQGDRNTALQLFRSAHARRNELDVLSQQQLQDHLQMLSGGTGSASPRPGSGSLLNSASSGQAVLARQLSSEIGKRQSEAAKLRTADPQGALEMLKAASQKVATSDLDQGMKTQLIRRIDLSVADTERFIRDNGADIELDRANQAVLEDIDRQREVKGQVQIRLAELVDQFNTLRDEQRYAEMEVVARRAYDMAPDEPVAQQVWENAKFIRRTMLNQEIAQLTEAGVDGAFRGIRRDAGEALRDIDSPVNYDGEYWEDFVKGRTGSSERVRRSASELEIQQKLRTPVLPRYDNMALAEVVQSLSELTGVNIYLDPRGLGQEGVRTDSPVSLDLGQEVSLESALSLILEPLHLTYMIKDEVLKVTSEQLRDGEIEARVYNVADLVVPIPNFVPTSGMGLQGLINDAYEALPNIRRSGGGPIAYIPGQAALDVGVPGNPNVLQQQQQFGGGSIGAGGGGNALSGGPGGLGGAAAADFDSLIDLIVSTVEHDSWMENGTGEGEIQPFPTNLSLVISQTERVHAQIADLLEQLRRLQDLQVTIEVRFIRLTDSFFERIGIDFDFNIEDGGGALVGDLVNVGATFEPSRPSSTVGTSANPTSLADPLPDFTVDLDVPFRQSSFGLTVPQFGTPMDVGSFGFAILSDIEAFFLINASQGDVRANVLQAPKVTLINGQQAIVVDTAFTPFVISVIPVVGEFAAAQQPVIVVLSEGTMMTVQAVVSDDRRYVRLTLVPFFSQIGEVNTFTFEGTETTSTTSNTTDQDQNGTNEQDDNTQNVVRSGTTVQLPTFEVIAVATTVSVPDGGTVLLGGIKRLREGRNEFGVPLLSKVPYIDRLFRNVGSG
ncbi:MAG: hypothetical protein ACR2NM_04635, partial [Bythopirellula sp.]